MAMGLSARKSRCYQQRRAALGRAALPLSNRVPASDRRNGGSGGANLDRGEDPGHRTRRPRVETMRHWITSFLWLMDGSGYTGNGAGLEDGTKVTLEDRVDAFTEDGGVAVDVGGRGLRRH